MRRLIIVTVLFLLLVSLGCVSNTKELAEIDELTIKLEEKDIQINDLSNQLEVRDKKISEVGEKNSELSSQIVTKNEEIDSNNDNIKQLESGLSQSQETNTNTVDFFKEYSIALNNIHIAYLYINMGKVNIKNTNEYVQTGDYTYSSADRLYDSSGKHILKARELLLKSDKKLREIRDDAPNSFFKTDVENRLDQVDSMLRVADDYYSALDYRQKQLYEVNYGSKEKASEYYNESFSLLPKATIDLNDMNLVHNKIDVEWDQDWYPNFLIN